MLILLLLWNLMNISIVVNCFNMNVLYMIFIIKGQLLYFLVYFFMNLFIQSVTLIINFISIIFVNLQSSYSKSLH